jgi:hypothetical protein
MEAVERSNGLVLQRILLTITAVGMALSSVLVTFDADGPGEAITPPDVMYEHSETWNWVTGASAVLQFVTVHKVPDGKIVLWKDYRDFAGLANHAPKDWMEQLAQADMSWMFDATGLI